MPTDPWSGSRYPASTAAPNVSQDIQNAVNDLADGTCPSFATAAARDTAFTNWKNAGNTAFSGMLSFTQSDGRYWRYDTGSTSWKYAGGNPPPIVACGAGAGWSLVTGHLPGAYIDASGLVHLVGAVSPNTSYSPQDGATHTALTIPAGYRPAAGVIVPISVPYPVNTVPILQIDVGGVGSIIGGAGSTTVGTGSGHYLDGIVYHPGYAGGVPY